MKSRGTLIGVVVLTAGFYLLVSSSGAEPYFLGVDEAAVASESMRARPMRIKGNAIPESYTHKDGTTVHRFDIRGEHHTLAIHYDGNRLPDTFGMAVSGGREIVAEGKLGADGVLEATEIIAKCPSKYEDGKVPEKYKSAGGG